MKWRFAALFVGLLTISALIAGASAYLPRGEPRAAISGEHAGWREVDWPYLRDQFGAGKAFECDASLCGAALRVTFRAKIGFCNCATGVSDDEELERIGDVALVDADYKAGAPGRELQVGHMKGRSRPYAPRNPGNASPAMLSIAFNDRCDVIVATATGREALAGEAATMAFLNSEPVLRWAERAIGF